MVWAFSGINLDFSKAFRHLVSPQSSIKSNDNGSTGKTSSLQKIIVFSLQSTGFVLSLNFAPVVQLFSSSF